MTCGMRQCRCGSTRGCHHRRSPNELATVSKSCCVFTPNAWTTASNLPTTESRQHSAMVDDGPDGVVAIPRISHSYRPTTAFRGIWLHTRGRDGQTTHARGPGVLAG